MAISIISSVQSMVRKLAAAIHGSPSSSSLSDQVLSGMKKDLESLESTLWSIKAVLNDAEKREIRDDYVKLWLKELRWVAYDAENVLGEYQYEVRQAASLKRKRQDDQVYDFTSVLLRLRIPQRIKGIMKRFEVISEDRNRLQLKEEDGPRRYDPTSHVPQPSSSLIDESVIFGREDDKEAVIQMLLSDKVSSKISVISIVGMGGLGKTTLAQCVYNDPRVCQYFDSMGWVCVSDDFDVKRLTEEIIQSITKNSCGLTHLDALQSNLKEIVDGKKVLVVFDDVWNEKSIFWESLKVPFRSAATTRVLVTTRNESVVRTIQTMNNIDVHRLGCLPEGICWSLFCYHAFGGQNQEEHPRLVEVGREIMQKCGGLPLAVKTLGSLLLNYGTDEESWREVLESEIWELDRAKDTILPALKLSYYRMPSHLKPCFLFTSMYPKDFKFEKHKVIQMWIAQNYILPQENKSLEEIGSEYFDELKRRSFFLCSKYEKYVLHDIVHDLARHISENEHDSIVLESDGKACPIAKEVRHLFVECQQGATLGQVPLEITRDLRTLIVSMRDYSRAYLRTLKVDDDQFENSVHLRVLELEVDCKKLPYSIVKLKHLCYLNWSRYRPIRCTPCSSRPLPSDVTDGLCSLSINHGSSSVSHLYNMQTLHIICEHDYVRLLNSLRDLANLGHLHLESYAKSDSTCILPSIMPDANLTHRGMICYSSAFSKLVEITLQIRGANWLSLLPFSQMPSLRRLRVKSMQKLERVGHENYCYCPLHFGSDDIRKSVITNNVGFPRLEELLFENMYRWKEWSGVMDGDFPCLRKLTLKTCPLLSQIPMLPSSLKTLHISHCNSLKSLLLNVEQIRFPYMEELVFDDMPEWEEWAGLNSGDFPRLRKLIINRCQKLQGVPTLLSSSLELLSIKSCWSLTSLAGLQNLTSLESLKLRRCPNLHISPQEEEGLPSKPQHVKIVDCPLLQEWCNRHHFNCIQQYYGLAELTINHSDTIIKDLGVHNLTSLKRMELRVDEYYLPSDEWLPPMIQILEVFCGNNLYSLPLHQNLLLLTRLEIRSCPVLDSVDGMHNLPNLEELSIASCPRLYMFSHDKCSLPSSLQSLSVIDCQKLWSLPLLHENLSSLEKIEVLNCPELTTMPGLHSLSSLKTLIIRQCPRLRLSSDEQLSSMPHFLSIADCPKLEEWCQQQSIPYSQVTIGATAMIRDLFYFSFCFSKDIVQTSWLEEWRQQQSIPYNPVTIGASAIIQDLLYFSFCFSKDIVQTTSLDNIKHNYKDELIRMLPVALSLACLSQWH